MEKKIRRELAALNAKFHTDPRYSEVISTVNRHLHGDVNLFALDWFPEQDTEFWTLLVDMSYLLKLEIPISADEAIEITDYSRVEPNHFGRSRAKQIELAVALDLAESIDGS